MKYTNSLGRTYYLHQLKRKADGKVFRNFFSKAEHVAPMNDGMEVVEPEALPSDLEIVESPAASKLPLIERKLPAAERAKIKAEKLARKTAKKAKKEAKRKAMKDLSIARKNARKEKKELLKQFRAFRREQRKLYEKAVKGKSIEMRASIKKLNKVLGRKRRKGAKVAAAPNAAPAAEPVAQTVAAK